MLKRLTNKTGEEGLDLNSITLRDIDLSPLAINIEPRILNLNGSGLVDCSMEGGAFDGSNFSATILDNVSFRNSSLRGCDFRSSLIFECDLSDADVAQADFRHLDKDSNFGVTGNVILAGQDARGYLKWRGAIVDEVDAYHVYQFHPKFGIVSKILEKISGQKNSQKRGLTQRGEAQNDPPFARGFLEYIESKGLISVGRNDLVSVTATGRTEVSKMVNERYLCPAVVEYLSSNS